METTNLDEIKSNKDPNTNTVKRDSRFELLRIICMVMIVFYHMKVYGEYFSFSYLNEYVVNMFCFGKLGVNVFFIISGYFMAKSKAKFSKFIKLELQVIFYCCVIYLAYGLVNTILSNGTTSAVTGGGIQPVSNPDE